MAAKPVLSTDPKCVVQGGGSVDLGPDGEIVLTETQCNALRPGDLIGVGSFAAAYSHRTNPERVVKFTADPNDAKASIRLQGKNLKGSVNVHRVVRLKGVDGVTAVMEKAGRWSPPKRTPIYGIITERVSTEGLNDAQTAVVSLVNGKMFYLHKEIAGISPKQFKLADWADPYEIETKCKRQPHRAAGCQKAVEQVYDAIDELANEGGVIATDVHSGNWGVRSNGDLVMLDFGVSHAEGKSPPIKSLAGNTQKGKHMAKRKKARRSLGQTNLVTYDYSSGSKRITGLSKTGKWAVGLIAAGALAWLLWPKGPKVTEASKKAVEKAKANAAKTGSKYTVVRGDSWSKIAEKVYGDYRWWPALWDANRMGDKFTNPDALKVGEVITVPALPTSDAAFKGAVFNRAAAERAWAAERAKAAAAKKAFKTPVPPVLLEATTLPAVATTPVTVEASSGGGALPPALPPAGGTTGSTTEKKLPSLVIPPQDTESQMNELESRMQETLSNRL